MITKYMLTVIKTDASQLCKHFFDILYNISSKGFFDVEYELSDLNGYKTKFLNMNLQLIYLVSTKI